MTKIQAGNIHTSQVMDCQVHAIGKAMRPLFTDLVTIIGEWYASNYVVRNEIYP